jgi:simple sugar transport system permease protein
MTEISPEKPPDEGPPPQRKGGDYAPSVAARLALWQKAGGIVTPLLTVIFAFVMGGLVVLVTTGNNPLQTYKEIFRGTGLDWFFQVGSHDIGLPWSDARVWFPWNTDDITSQAAFNLQQTLLIWIPLVLTGLAVAFAFRCGMFNIGGQGQYLVGSYAAVYVGTHFSGLGHWWHVVLGVLVAALMGGLLAGIAGFLKATVGAHEVISTIMLNWIVIYVGLFLFGREGPLQNTDDVSVPVSDSVLDQARICTLDETGVCAKVFWGDPILQGLHAGFFVALFALVVYWISLNRTTLGFEVRAVGYNPEAARYGGINVAKNYFLAMAIAGAFAGLAGGLDILGWQFRTGQLDILNALLPFTGIAVALLGRNTAVGVGLAALLFAALAQGTSTRNLDPNTFRPELATNLTQIIQGLVVLFVGADILILWIWNLRRKAGFGKGAMQA